MLRQVTLTYFIAVPLGLSTLTKIIIAKNKKSNIMDPIIIAALITVAGTIITTIIVKFFQRKKRHEEPVSYYRTIEQTNTVKKASEKFVLPVSLVQNSKILKHRVQSFDDLFKTVFQSANFKETPLVHEIPELFASYSNAKIKYAQWGNKIDINLLISVLIERIRTFNQEDEIYYDQALNNLSLITTSQLKLLVLHQVTYGLIQFLMNQSNEMLPNLSNLVNYLQTDFTATVMDLDHLISQGLINDMFPQRFTEQIYNSDLDSKIQELKNLLDNLQTKFFKLQIWSYNLSPVCRIITSLKIKELLNDSSIEFIYPPKELADLYVKNLIASADVMVYGTNNIKDDKHKNT
jgi:hypothetical protein